MADTYCNFRELAKVETSGVDFDIVLRRETLALAIVAPHGGGIEAGTSELADAIADPATDQPADQRHSFYTFEGLKPSGNGVLHITSTHFDEPMCLTLIGACQRVVTIHGEQTTASGEVFVGGIDKALGARLTVELRGAGFVVGVQPDENLQGLEPDNLCNLGKTNAGVQLELSRDARSTLFKSLSEEGRKHTTPRFDVFVQAVRRALRNEGAVVSA